MTAQEKGLYLPNGEFISKKEIDTKLLIQGKANMMTDMPISRDFKYWGERFEQRQSQYKETVIRKNKVEIYFDQEPIINLWGDQHIGSPETDYKRINAEAEIILKTPNSYLMVLGDTVDGFFFNPAQFEQIEQAPEQFEYINALFKALGEKRKLLAAWSGDHEDWVKKSGANPYAEFSQKFDAYYMHGVGFVNLKVGEIDYKMVAAHRLPGFSMYNNSHAEMRLSREVQGGDIYVGAHSHVKGFVEQEVQYFGGESKLVKFLSLGPYKASDEYSRKKGFSVKTEKGMYGSAIKLSKDSHHIQYYGSILEANGERLKVIENL